MRIALGAEAKHVIAMIGGQGISLVTAGIVLGLGGSFLVLRVIQSMLFGASPIDLPVFAAVSALCWRSPRWWRRRVPARRAARVSPLEALRAE